MNMSPDVLEISQKINDNAREPFLPFCCNSHKIAKNE